MRLADLVHRTAFRLALGVTVFVVIALVLASAVGYGLLRQQLNARQTSRVTEIYTALEQTSLSGDQTDLVEGVTTRIAASPDKSTVFLLRDPGGKVLASSMPDIWYKPGWSIVEAATLGVQTDYPYRVFAGSVGGNLIVVGLTDADLDDLAEISFAAFGWAALGALVIAAAIGVLIATRIQIRISEVETTLDRVAAGDLSARLSVSRSRNDLDLIALAINRTLARLGTLVEALHQVSSDVAHDLRTPLNRLRIQIEAATAAEEEGRPVTTHLAEALSQCDRVTETFSALLRIAQIEAGARKERFLPVDLAALLSSTSGVYEDVASDAGMTLTRTSAGPVLVWGDRELLTQMIANLIENAIRHCPPATFIRCSAGFVGDGVVLEIVDTGPGIPAGQRQKVLQRMYRLEQSRTTPGSGLGLSLVKAVTDLHDAELILGDANPGLSVSVIFPRLRPEDGAHGPWLNKS